MTLKKINNNMKQEMRKFQNRKCIDLDFTDTLKNYISNAQKESNKIKINFFFFFFNVIEKMNSNSLSVTIISI